jgi:hypothetical protein
MALIAAPWAFAVFIELDRFGRRRLAPGVALALVSLDAVFGLPVAAIAGAATFGSPWTKYKQSLTMCTRIFRAS